MTVLFDHSQPFLLAHGGFQIQIEQTKLALERVGVQIENLQWWDDSQRGQIIHYFGRPSEPYVDLAHRKNIKIVLGDLLTEMGSRSWAFRKLQKTVMTSAQAILPSSFTARMAWNSFRKADACVALTPWEARLMTDMFDAPPERVHVIPNGVEAVFLESHSSARGPWLTCTAVITERKRVVELAQAAVAAQTPLWVLGKPYGKNDPYATRFLEIARQHPSIIRYEGAIDDRSRLAQIYREARGFVLLSTKESLSLSALEAAACGCPLLLSDLPWARGVFKENARYCPLGTLNETAAALRQFYDAAPGLPPSFRPQTWNEVALALKSLYQRLVSQG